MECEEFKLKIREAFSAGILEVLDDRPDSLQLEVNLDKIWEICMFINAKRPITLVSMFANDERSLESGGYAIYYLFAERKEGWTLLIKIKVHPERLEFQSISGAVHTAALYEREIHDMFGLVPVGHPELKRLVFHSNWPDHEFPLRKTFDVKHKPAFARKDIPFKKVTGEGIYEIPVGPVHAGIIEPGHFRFSVAGEPIINLEAQLYFVHKGIEKMCEGWSVERCLYVSERISGDETFANSLTYCQAVEKAAGMDIPARARYMRVIFAELERLISHLGDLAGICVDVAYGFAASQFNMLRGWAYGLADELCGMRFLRSVNKLGGMRMDFAAGKEKSLLEQLKRLEDELGDTVKITRSNGFFIDRVENTGILKHDIAVDLNAVGPAGRASGVRYDIRRSFPYAAYKDMDFSVPEHNNGDVNCRMNMKIEECFQSISLMRQGLEGMPQGKVWEAIGGLQPYKTAFAMTEAPRGENIHWIMTGENDTLYRYKIRTPSFCNWPALCHAVKGNIVPDFPLINKSFNLSYAGNDL